MSCNLIKQKEAINFIKKAVTEIYESKDYGLIKEDVNERALAFRLAYYMQRDLSPYLSSIVTIDAEYGKKGDTIKECFHKCIRCENQECIMKIEYQGFLKKHENDKTIRFSRMYPDILVHSRFISDNNLIAIEIKKYNQKAQRKKDIAKLTYLTCQKKYSPYKYKYGFFLDFNLKECFYTLYINKEPSYSKILWQKYNE